MKQVLVPVAQGSEELETVAIVDVLRRTGAEVTMASVDEMEVVMSKGIRIKADALLKECADREYDLIVLPGGLPGSERLRDSQDLASLLKKQDREGKLFGAICSAPAVVLEHHGFLAGRRATCHPNFSYLMKSGETSDAPVVRSGNCVTSRGAGTAVPFALTLVELLYGIEKREEVARGMALI